MINNDLNNKNITVDSEIPKVVKEEEESLDMSRLIHEDNNYNNDRQPTYQEVKHDHDVKIKKSLKKDVK